MNLRLYAATVLGMLPGAIAYNLLADSILGGRGLYVSVAVVIIAFWAAAGVVGFGR